jgi:hypothetical protein
MRCNHFIMPLVSRTIFLAGIFGISVLSGCGGKADDRSPIPEWIPMAEVNANLPAGIKVYEGENRQLPLRAWYVRVNENDPDITTRVVVSEDEDRRETATGFSEALGACVVINGGYFRMDLDPAEHVGLLLIGGDILEPPTASVLREGVRFWLSRAAIGFGPEGDIDVAWTISRRDTLWEVLKPAANRPGRPDTLHETWEMQFWPVQDALAAGPCLLTAGEINITSDEEVFFGTSIPKVHPRTAAGYTKEGQLILLVVDGRQDESRGVDLTELALIMKDLGCVEALNLDGGGSSTLVANGQRLNQPAGGSVEREVMSALAVFCE